MNIRSVQLMGKSALLIAVVLFVVSCTKQIDGNRQMTTQDFQVALFTKVKTQIPGKVVIKKGTEPVVKISAESNLMRYIQVKRQGDLLVISTEPGKNLDFNRQPIIEIELPKIEGFYLHGSAEATIDEVFGTSFENEINGSGDIKIDYLQVADYSSEINGSGKVEIIDGIATEGSVLIKGSGNWKGQGVTLTNAKAEIRGSGDIRTSVLEKLDVKIDGSGTVRYWGAPLVNSVIQGSGKVIPQ